MSSPWSRPRRSPPSSRTAASTHARPTGRQPPSPRRSWPSRWTTSGSTAYAAAFPYLNAQVGKQTVHLTRSVHLGIAVDPTPDGLVTPVVRDADRLRLGALGQQISTVIDRARAGSIEAGDASGATFTLSDSGPHGALLVAPVLGSDQVAALAVGSVRAKPVAVEREPDDYVVAVHPVGTLGLSFDHHAIDTGYAAGFLDRLREALETRDWSTEL